MTFLDTAAYFVAALLGGALGLCLGWCLCSLVHGRASRLRATKFSSPEIDAGAVGRPIDGDLRKVEDMPPRGKV